jgi:hypothetical protein
MKKKDGEKEKVFIKSKSTRKGSERQTEAWRMFEAHDDKS